MWIVGAKFWTANTVIINSRATLPSEPQLPSTEVLMHQLLVKVQGSQTKPAEVSGDVQCQRLWFFSPAFLSRAVSLPWTIALLPPHCASWKRCQSALMVLTHAVRAHGHARRCPIQPCAIWDCELAPPVGTGWAPSEQPNGHLFNKSWFLSSNEADLFEVKRHLNGRGLKNLLPDSTQRYLCGSVVACHCWVCWKMEKTDDSALCWVIYIQLFGCWPPVFLDETNVTGLFQKTTMFLSTLSVGMINTVVPYL